MYIEKVMTEIKTKRAYETPDGSDGFRILVDRLWPRGLTHERLACPMWAKDIAPSQELRKWFHADPTNRWAGFEERYKTELRDHPAFKDFLGEVASHSMVTFVYASKDMTHNEATVLRDVCDSVLFGDKGRKY